MRTLTLTPHTNIHALGSCTITQGNTVVLCTVSLDTLPPWLQGKNRGWLTAEYNMLPSATHTRSKRERTKISGRTQEIQRFISRALRAMLDLSKIPHSLIIDCDVLQADGGTRTASITGSAVALAFALKKLNLSHAQTGLVSAISVGLKDSVLFTDIDYALDSTIDIDMNLCFHHNVITKMVEIQGAAEGALFSQDDLNRMLAAALDASAGIFVMQQSAIEKGLLSVPDTAAKSPL